MTSMPTVVPKLNLDHAKVEASQTSGTRFVGGDANLNNRDGPVGIAPVSERQRIVSSNSGIKSERIHRGKRAVVTTRSRSKSPRGPWSGARAVTETVDGIEYAETVDLLNSGLGQAMRYSHMISLQRAAKRRESHRKQFKKEYESLANGRPWERVKKAEPKPESNAITPGAPPGPGKTAWTDLGARKGSHTSSVDGLELGVPANIISLFTPRQDIEMLEKLSKPSRERASFLATVRPMTTRASMSKESVESLMQQNDATLVADKLRKLRTSQGVRVASLPSVTPRDESPSVSPPRRRVAERANTTRGRLRQTDSLTPSRNHSRQIATSGRITGSQTDRPRVLASREGSSRSGRTQRRVRNRPGTSGANSIVSASGTSSRGGTASSVSFGDINGGRSRGSAGGRGGMMSVHFPERPEGDPGIEGDDSESNSSSSDDYDDSEPTPPQLQAAPTARDTSSFFMTDVEVDALQAPQARLQKPTREKMGTLLSPASGPAVFSESASDSNAVRTPTPGLTPRPPGNSQLEVDASQAGGFVYEAAPVPGAPPDAADEEAKARRAELMAMPLQTLRREIFRMHRGALTMVRCVGRHLKRISRSSYPHRENFVSQAQKDFTVAQARLREVNGVIEIMERRDPMDAEQEDKLRLDANKAKAARDLLANAPNFIKANILEVGLAAPGPQHARLLMRAMEHSAREDAVAERCMAKEFKDMSRTMYNLNKEQIKRAEAKHTAKEEFQKLLPVLAAERWLPIIAVARFAHLINYSIKSARSHRALYAIENIAARKITAFFRVHVLRQSRFGRIVQRLRAYEMQQNIEAVAEKERKRMELLEQEAEREREEQRRKAEAKRPGSPTPSSPAAFLGLKKRIPYGPLMQKLWTVVPKTILEDSPFASDATVGFGLVAANAAGGGVKGRVAESWLDAAASPVLRLLAIGGLKLIVSGVDASGTPTATNGGGKTPKGSLNRFSVRTPRAKAAAGKNAGSVASPRGVKSPRTGKGGKGGSDDSNTPASMAEINKALFYPFKHPAGPGVASTLGQRFKLHTDTPMTPMRNDTARVMPCYEDIAVPSKETASQKNSPSKRNASSASAGAGKAILAPLIESQYEEPTSNLPYYSNGQKPKTRPESGHHHRGRRASIRRGSVLAGSLAADGLHGDRRGSDADMMGVHPILDEQNESVSGDDDSSNSVSHSTTGSVSGEGHTYKKRWEAEQQDPLADFISRALAHPAHRRNKEFTRSISHLIDVTPQPFAGGHVDLAMPMREDPDRDSQSSQHPAHGGGRRGSLKPGSRIGSVQPASTEKHRPPAVGRKNSVSAGLGFGSVLFADGDSNGSNGHSHAHASKPLTESSNSGSVGPLGRRLQKKGSTLTLDSVLEGDSRISPAAVSPTMAPSVSFSLQGERKTSRNSGILKTPGSVSSHVEMSTPKNLRLLLPTSVETDEMSTPNIRQAAQTAAAMFDGSMAAQAARARASAVPQTARESRLGRGESQVPAKAFKRLDSAV